jgi:hypothetical protein
MSSPSLDRANRACANTAVATGPKHGAPPSAPPGERYTGADADADADADVGVDADTDGSRPQRTISISTWRRLLATPGLAAQRQRYSRPLRMAAVMPGFEMWEKAGARWMQRSIMVV